jgi:BMFP domain-containing protein YqiC
MINAVLGAIAGAFGDLDTFSADVRRTLLAILSRGGSAAQQEVAHLRWRVSELESKLERANVQSAQYAQQVQLLEKRVADIEARFDNRNAAV